MSLISRISDSLSPVIPNQKVDSSKLMAIGSISKDDIKNRYFKMFLNKDQKPRSEILKEVHEMASSGAIADKALSKLCQDATSSEIVIDAPTRRRKIIESFLKRIDYQKHRNMYLYLMLRNGDLFIQPEYVESVEIGKIGYISGLYIMPADTMIRNTNERDQFYDIGKSFAQVENIDIDPKYSTPPALWFPYVKIIHGRNDNLKNKNPRYGMSMWYSGVDIFNMSMMNITDASIMRHIAIQKLRVHQVGKNIENKSTIDANVINSYKTNFENQFDSNSTDVFIDGATEIKEIGGIEGSMGSVDDLMMILSLLSVAVEYPIDLLSGMISRGSGGEELFRKEVVLKRTIDSIVEKEKNEILMPLINRELLLNGNFGDYRITTIPASFEDQTKKSKRGLGEMQALVKSPRKFHEENNDEISWEDELEMIEDDLKQIQELTEKYPDAIKIISRSAGRTDPQAGAQGDSTAVENQPTNKTPGDTGND